MLRFWNRVIVSLADRIVVHGSLYKQKLLRSGANAERIFFLPLLHLFLGFERLQQLYDNLGDIEYRPELLFFGRIRKYKGLETLVTAFERVLDDFRAIGSEAPRLFIAGNGAFPGGLKQNLPMNIALLDRIIGDREAEELFRRCMAIVLPYNDATQSALIAAAYFFQKPVIVTNTGALPEYVENGVTGYIVPPSDSTALARVMMKLLCEKESAKIMGKAGRDWYDEQRLRETQSLIELYHYQLHRN
jgi:glycosyltransferase involved in cell wall biosynthesis